MRDYRRTTLYGISSMACGKAINASPGPDLATFSTSTPNCSAMNPRTPKIANPEITDTPELQHENEEKMTE